MRIRHLAVALGLVVLLAAFLAGGGHAAVNPMIGALADPPDPQPLDPTGIAWLDNIYYGAVPPGAEEGPVLVFVHGMGGSAEDWWTLTPHDGVNDMYVTAYQAGYRTAFVTLDFPFDPPEEGEPPHSIRTNGEILARQLPVIADYYGVDQVDIIAHSKGGIDSQVAIVYEGCAPLVRRVFTLAAPHQGSELADLVHAPPVKGLAEVLGLANEATESLQTANMQDFRATTDPEVEKQSVRYYTAAGTDTGPVGSLSWFTGLYLSTFGPNDGLVRVASTELARADTLFVQPYSHFNIHMGHMSFPWIEAELRGLPGPYRAYLPFVVAGVGQGPPGDGVKPSLVALRGGHLTEPVTQTVSVEVGVRTANFVLFASHEEVTISLTGPGGLEYPVECVSQGGDGFLGDAVAWSSVVEEPLAGEWTMRLEGPSEAAYLLVVIAESPLQVELRGFPERMVALGQELGLQVGAVAPADLPLMRRIEAYISRPSSRHGYERTEVRSNPGSRLDWRPDGEGTYTIYVAVKGRMGGMGSFERAFVRSIAVAGPGHLSSRTQPVP